MKNGVKRTHRKKKKTLAAIQLICWIVIPIAILTMLVLDGFGLYPFNTERIIVMGAGISIMLIPFFSEITVSNFTFKKDKIPK